MPEFLELLPPQDALQTFLAQLSPQAANEEIQTASALGRVNLEPVVAPHPLPSFPRTTVDGFAVRAADTYGASESLPAYLSVVGEVPMGDKPDFSLAPAACALIHTGGMLPQGSDAVVMVEYTQSAREGEVEILRSVAVGENVINVGEDVAKGQVVIPAGTRLRPAEIGGLMALGVTSLIVARQPRVGILSSGDEIVPPESELQPGQVRDVNAYTLSALVQSAGGIPVRYGIVSDRFEALRDSAARARAECDLVVITAGSSASTRDLTSRVIDDLGEPGVLVHGVNVRPGKPTILAVCDGKAMIGLPGNPVSALVIASLFVVPVVEALQGLQRPRPHASVPARLRVNLPSQAGREDWVAVRLVPDPQGPGRYLADPIFGKSNLIFTLARADGLLRIHADATGLSAGENVQVMLF
jgi:molybdopterin molybdotransferase